MNEAEIARRAHDLAASALARGLTDLSSVPDDRRGSLAKINATASLVNSGPNAEPIQELGRLLYGSGTNAATWLTMRIYRALIVEAVGLGDAPDNEKEAFVAKLESEAAVAQLVAMRNGW